MAKRVKVGISARHVHLSRDHIDILFGPGHRLRPFKQVYQPGQYAAEETVDLVALQATFKNVRVLGPERGLEWIDGRPDCAALFVVRSGPDEFKLVPSARFPEFQALP